MAGPYLDLQVVDDFLDAVSCGLDRGWMLPSVLLDADRRGVGMRALVLGILANAQRQVQALDAADTRALVLHDLADVADQLGMQGSMPDPLLNRVLADSGAIDISSALTDPTCMLWLETIGSLAAEGYALEWLARRSARRMNTEWRDVVIGGDELIRRRRAGQLLELREVP